MTDQPTPLTDDDLSAAFDGEADAATVARIDDDPTARARQDELAAAAQRLRAATVQPLEPGTREDLLAAALDEPLAPAASTRSRGPAPWLVAAAVAALVAVGLGLIWSGRAGNTNRFNTVGNRISNDASSGAATESNEKSSDLAGGGSAATTTIIPGHGQPTTTLPGTAPSTIETVFLGSFATGADLRTALATSFPASAADTVPPGTDTTTASAPPRDEALDRCAEQLQITLSLPGEPLHQGYATVGSKDVLVYEFASTSFADGSPTTLVAAVGAQACDQVVVFER